jgi:CheY-like chemotaxis protein
MPVLTMPYRILIADDNQCLRELVGIILDSCGYGVTITADGLACWEALQDYQPDLVVLDIDMPQIDGCEVCRRIKSQPETRDIPVILVSGRQDAGDLARGAGANAFLSKPFAIEDLRVQIEALL